MVTINEIPCQLELGKWSVDQINCLLEEAWQYSADSGDRILFIAKKFFSTPFIFDAKLTIAKDGLLKIRFESFDCQTFVQNMVALCKSRTFEEFVQNLYEIEYIYSETKAINNHPETGNRFIFGCESLLINATNKGYLTEITEGVIDKSLLTALSIDIKAIQRPPIYDPLTLFMTPKYGEKRRTEYFIGKENFDRIDFSQLKSGDIALLSKGEECSKGIKQGIFIRHFVFLEKENDKIFFIHASKDFAWKPNATRTSKPLHTGIYFDLAHKKEHLGVSYGAKYAGDELITHFKGIDYYAYNPETKREFNEYFKANFWGVKFIRLT